MYLFTNDRLEALQALQAGESFLPWGWETWPAFSFSSSMQVNFSCIFAEYVFFMLCRNVFLMRFWFPHSVFVHTFSPSKRTCGTVPRWKWNCTRSRVVWFTYSGHPFVRWSVWQHASSKQERVWNRARLFRGHGRKFISGCYTGHPGTKVMFSLLIALCYSCPDCSRA